MLRIRANSESRGPCRCGFCGDEGVAKVRLGRGVSGKGRSGKRGEVLCVSRRRAAARPGHAGHSRDRARRGGESSQKFTPKPSRGRVDVKADWSRGSVSIFIEFVCVRNAQVWCRQRSGAELHEQVRDWSIRPGQGHERLREFGETAWRALTVRTAEKVNRNCSRMGACRKMYHMEMAHRSEPELRIDEMELMRGANAQEVA